MKRISLINILPLLALAVLVLTSCKKDDNKYQYVIDKMQGEWIIDYTYTPDYYLRFTIENDVIHSQTNAPTDFHLLFITQNYKYDIINERLINIGGTRYIYSVTDSTLFLEFGGGTTADANGPKTIYKFNKIQ